MIFARKYFRNIRIFFALLCTLLSACKSQKSESFVYCSEGAPSSFNPQIAMDGTTYNATYPIYNTLVAFKYGTTDIIPSLAENWQIDAKGLEYTFHLRKNVAFHTTPYFTPTRNFNVDDVIFSFQRQKDRNHPYHNVNNAIYRYFQSMSMNKVIKDIVKINDHRVKFILQKVEASFLKNLAMDFASILSKEYADQLLKSENPQKIDYEPIGTGPFSFIEYQKDTFIKYKAFESYFSKRGNIKAITFVITPDASLRLQKLKTNECQFMAYPQVTDLETIKKNKNLKLIKKPGFNIGYLAMNVKKKPFDNQLVRQAINHALNKEAYIKTIYLGNAKKAKNPIPPMLWGYNENTEEYAYDPQKAKTLLKKAGFSKGFKTDLWVLPVARPYMPAGKKLGEMMQMDLAKIGISVKLLTYDWPTFLSKAGRGDHTLIQIGWRTDNGDPDNFFYTLLSCDAIKGGSNLSSWCHKAFDHLVTKAKRSRNIQERINLYKKAQKIFHQESPWVPLVHSMVYRAMNKNVFGYKIHPTDRDIFTFINIKKDSK